MGNGIKKGKFIVIDGLDGSGKTSLVERLKTMKGFEEVVFTREPGGTEFSEKVRNLVFENNISVESELLMMFAARIEHIKYIKQLLEEGKMVISDRYVGSSFMYQGGLGFDKVEMIDRFSNTIKPDLELLLYTNYGEYVKRKTKAKEVNRLDPATEEDFTTLFNRLKEYQAYAGALGVDTTNFTPQETLKSFLYHLEKVK